MQFIIRLKDVDQEKKKEINLIERLKPAPEPVPYRLWIVSEGKRNKKGFLMSHLKKKKQSCGATLNSQ